MASSVFFPYFYLSNDVLLRHQFVYGQSVLRVHPSDRPPRDSKHLKRILSEMTQLGFIENAVHTQYDETVNRHFLRTIRRGFQENRPSYLNVLGKYEKERASSKTYHLCRKSVWEELVQQLVELGIALVDHYDEWCFSTRKMVIAMNTCFTLAQQKALHLPRCTDAIEHDELATLIECLPLDDGNDAQIQRGILEFSYPIPENILSMQLDRLQTLRDQFLDILNGYSSSFVQWADQVQQASTPAELEIQLKEYGRQLTDMFQKITQGLNTRKEPVHTAYGQYRWYISPQSPLGRLSLNSSIVRPPLAFHKTNVFIDPALVDEVTTYAGCFVLAQDEPRLSKKTGGLLKRLFSFGK